MKKTNGLPNQILTKKVMYFMAFALIIMSVTSGYTKDKFKDGYQFFLSFFSILPIIMLGTVTMLRSVYQLEGPPRSPFHLLKYSYYFIMLFISCAPFLLLWQMRDVISQLKWQLTIFKVECKNEPNLFGSFLFILYLCAIIKKPLMAANRESRTPRW